MSTIELKFQRQLGNFNLDVEFSLPARGVISLFGDSGSGKTTLLRAIAGLERCEGYLRVNGETWQGEGSFLPVERRPIGYVFQEPSLFTHMSVWKNIHYGLNRTAVEERRIDSAQIIKWLGIGHLLKRQPQRLSGGERQRVAIARALLTSPRLLLMDEPLSALDERSKREILPYLERLHDELAIPLIYVSHLMKEVLRLSDQMVWLDQGKVRDYGSLQQMTANLQLAISHGDDASAVIDTQVLEHDSHYHLTVLQSQYGRFWVRQVDREAGEPLRVNIPARDVSLSLDREERSSILNIFPAVVEEIAPIGGGQMIVRLSAPQPPADQPLLARITCKSCDHLNLHSGSRVYARVKSVGLLE